MSTRWISELHALGLAPGDTVVVHSSFRNVRPVEGGPRGVVEALLEAVGPTGTLAMPSWTDDEDAPFDPTKTSALHLGVIADTFWRLPGVKRSGHSEAFAAKGPNADAILRDRLPLPPHRLESPIGRIWELGGKVLLLGVEHDSNTTLHLAEVLARVPYGGPKRCTVMENGVARVVEYRENDHCCKKFRLMDPWLRALGLQREGPVGNGHARLIDSRALVDVALEKLRTNPTVFLHARGECEECDEAWDSI